MKRTYVILSTIAILILLCSCGNSQSSSHQQTTQEKATETVAPQPTPVPTVTILGKEVSVSEIESGYSFELFGQILNTKTTEELHYEKVDIGDNGLDSFREIIPYMQNLKYISFDRCGTSDEAMALLRDELRDTVKIA